MADVKLSSKPEISEMQSDDTFVIVTENGEVRRVTKETLAAYGIGGSLENVTVKSGSADKTVAVPDGAYGIGSVLVKGDQNLTPGNIKAGVSILDVSGTYDPKLPESEHRDFPASEADTTLYSAYGKTISDIADAIQDRLNDTDAMTPLEMPEKIRAIDGGGQLSEITVRSQREDFVEVVPEGYYGIGSVTVKGDDNLQGQYIMKGIKILGVDGTYAPAQPALTTGSRTVKYNQRYTYTPPSGYVGFSRLDVTADVETELVPQEKTVEPRSWQQTVTPDSGYNCLSKVVVAGSSELKDYNIRENVTIFGVTGTMHEEGAFQEKTVTPTAEGFTVLPSSNYDALSSVTVNGDPNLTETNIRKGVRIFNKTGTYDGGSNYQDDKEAVTPGPSTQYIYPDYGYDALAKVIIAGDSNFKAENIRKGVKIWNTTGSYVSPVVEEVTLIPGPDDQTIGPPNGYVGYKNVTVKAVEVVSSEWYGTQDEYNALGSYDGRTLYYILEESEENTAGENI